MLRTCLPQLSLLAAIFVQAVSAVAAAAALLNEGGIPRSALSGAIPALHTRSQYAVSALEARRRKRFGPGDPGWGEWSLSSQVLEKTSES